jgi:chemotaxis protein CheD
VTTPAVYLKPGEWFFGEQPAVVETILGSCLGIIMRSSEGATCVAHCVLPRWEGGAAPDATGKFVDRTLAEMLRLFARRGVERVNLEVKLFGGAGVLLGGGGRAVQEVGRDNIEMAIQVLRREGIRVSACQVGGSRGRKIAVHTESGDVFVWTLGRSKAQAMPAPVRV